MGWLLGQLNHLTSDDAAPPQISEEAAVHPSMNSYATSASSYTVNCPPTHVDSKSDPPLDTDHMTCSVRQLSGNRCFACDDLRDIAQVFEPFD